MFNKRVSTKKLLLTVWPFLLALIVFAGVRTALRHSGFVEVNYSEKSLSGNCTIIFITQPFVSFFALGYFLVLSDIDDFMRAYSCILKKD